MDDNGTEDTYPDKIRYFFDKCKTNIETGTLFRDAEVCIREYIEESGYKPWVYMVGPHATNFPPGSSLPAMKHLVRVSDMRTYLSRRLMVIMGVGWYDYNSVTNKYIRTGGHYFNVYGYDYFNAWGEDHITLKVVNNLVNYGDRERNNMYDTVEMTAHPDDDTEYPETTGFRITGPGFQFRQQSFVEDIFVALPLK